MGEMQTEEYVNYEIKENTRVQKRGRRQNTPHRIWAEERNFSSLDMPEGGGLRRRVEGGGFPWKLLRMDPLEQEGFEGVLML